MRRRDEMKRKFNVENGVVKLCSGKTSGVRSSSSIKSLTMNAESNEKGEIRKIIRGK